MARRKKIKNDQVLLYFYLQKLEFPQVSEGKIALS